MRRWKKWWVLIQSKYQWALTATSTTKMLLVEWKGRTMHNGTQKGSSVSNPLRILCINCISKNLHVYYCKCCNLIDYATRYLFVNRYRVAASNATEFFGKEPRKAEFFGKQQCLFLVFRNNFEEITNTSLFLLKHLFLLKQLDYSLSISMKR